MVSSLPIRYEKLPYLKVTFGPLHVTFHITISNKTYFSQYFQLGNALEDDLALLCVSVLVYDIAH